MGMLKEFLRLEAAGGLLLFLAAILALLLANGALLDNPARGADRTLSIAKPLLLWINDGLMAMFFFVIVLELKREVLEGELSSPGQTALPGLGAVGASPCLQPHTAGSTGAIRWR